LGFHFLNAFVRKHMHRTVFTFTVINKTKVVNIISVKFDEFIFERNAKLLIKYLHSI